MKKLLLLASIALLVSCTEANRASARRNSDTSDDVKDNYGNTYDVVVIEGCEYYMHEIGYNGYMAKVDCNCVPDREEK